MRVETSSTKDAGSTQTPFRGDQAPAAHLSGPNKRVAASGPNTTTLSPPTRAASPPSAAEANWTTRLGTEASFWRKNVSLPFLTKLSGSSHIIRFSNPSRSHTRTAPELNPSDSKFSPFACLVLLSPFHITTACPHARIEMLLPSLAGWLPIRSSSICRVGMDWRARHHGFVLQWLCVRNRAQ